MNLSVVTPPAVEPVTAAAAFFQLKLSADPGADVTGEPQFAEVMRDIRTAREQCEQLTRRAFVTQTVLLTLGPPSRNPGERRGLAWYMNGCSSSWGHIELKRPPLISVTSVKYYDDLNTLQTVDPGLYFTTADLVPQLRFTEAFAHPSVYLLRDDAIQIEYVVGYPPVEADPGADPPIVADLAGNVPDSFKSAILLGVQLLFDKLTPAERADIERAQASLLLGSRINAF